jgi:hypothetical protein
MEETPSSDAVNTCGCSQQGIRQGKQVKRIEKGPKTEAELEEKSDVKAVMETAATAKQVEKVELVEEEEEEDEEKKAKVKKQQELESLCKIHAVCSKLELKVKGYFGDSWPQVQCSLDPSAKVFMNKPGDGVTEAEYFIQRLERIEPRPGKRQNRFNLHMRGGMVVELAALGEVEFDAWANAVEFCLREE